MSEVSCYSLPGLEIQSAISAIWCELQEQDETLPDLEQDGAGELNGSHLLVRYLRDLQVPLFACEVIDQRRQFVWEAAVMNIGEPAPAAFWRVRSGQEAPLESWQKILERHQPIVISPPYEPSFLAVLTAYRSSRCVVLAENVSQRAAIEEDLAYWRELARAQARVIRRQSAEKQVATLRTAPQTADSTPTPVVKQWSLKELPEWAALHEGSISVLPRALAGARKSPYHEPRHVYAALELLANTYRQVKLGRAPREQIKEELDRLGMEIGGSTDPSVAAKAGDEYFFRWRGRRRFLDQHIKKGVTRDPTYSMRVYFTWDDEEKVAIVGSLPFHLSNTLS